MSFCRFSSDDFRCDLYIYSDVRGGITTHVAGNKPRGYIPRLLPSPRYTWMNAGRAKRFAWRVWTRAWVWSMRLQHKYLDVAPRRALGLPFDGQTFNDPDGPSCAARVRALVALGYRVPARVIPALEACEADEL